MPPKRAKKQEDTAAEPTSIRRAKRTSSSSRRSKSRGRPGSTSKSSTKKEEGAASSSRKRTTKSAERKPPRSSSRSKSPTAPRKKRTTKAAPEPPVLDEKSNLVITPTTLLDASGLVLWRRPFLTAYYFLLELVELSVYYARNVLWHKYRHGLFVVAALALCIVAAFRVEGSHLPLLLLVRKRVLWYGYWMALGIASSIGLGTGLHTFLLYLGPFIAKVTMAAYECKTLRFPEPPFPDEVVCPNLTTTIPEDDEHYLTIPPISEITFLDIMSKVRMESFMWGAGTAIGELPPYFMARASALSNRNISEVEDAEELEEFEHLLEAERNHPDKLSLSDRMRLAVLKVIKRVGFWGILLCASVPNPLFDLAGITCGHFLVNFWTFFGATLVGKAIVKMHLQKTFVIFLFSEHHIDSLLDWLAKWRMPASERLIPLFREWLANEKAKLHSPQLASLVDKENIIQRTLNLLVQLMIVFFVVSIVNSLAQKRFKRLKRRKSL